MDCSHIPELSYAEFGRRMHDRITGKRIPLSGSFELTFRCNLRCKHCYLDGHRDGLPGLEELSLEEIREILDQVADAGCLWLLLTGGEPLVRDDFLDIYTYAKHKGFLLSLFTNGTLLTPEIADVLAEYPPFKIEITLYGRTQATYERVTGIPGSYDRCMRGIELLMERDLPLRLKTMVLTLNQHELEDIKAYAESLDVDFRFDPLVNAGLNGSQIPTQFRISPQEVVALDLADAKRMGEWQQFCDNQIAVPQNSEYLYQCGAGIHTFHIDPYGRLSACMIARDPAYDLRRGTFREGWREFLFEERSQKRTRDVECADCELMALCGQCPGWGQLEHGDKESRVEYLCEVAHLRAEVFGVRVPIKQ
jgi:radical SAM protein with 4Fe4S-binding SPASM domain